MRERDYDGGLGLARPANGAQRLDRDEAMQLLASVDYGRVVFTLNALPAVRPVNHLVDDDHIIIRTRLSAAISTVVRSADPDMVVAYEADKFDPEHRVRLECGGYRPCTDGQRSRRGLALRTTAASVGQSRRHCACHGTRCRQRLPDRRELIKGMEPVKTTP